MNSSNKKRQLSDVEEGEVSNTESSSSSSSSESSVFNDGYDSDLIGDEEDRKKLDGMTEKEREEEIYRRTEQRDLLMKRFEMKKKLKQQQKAAKKAEKKKLKEEKRKKMNNSKSKIKKSVKISKEFIQDEEENEEEGEEKKNLSREEDDEANEDEDLNNSSLTMMSDRRKINESKRKDTDVSKALANLKADREKKKQQAEDNKQRLEKMQKHQKKLRTEDVFSSSSNDEDDDEDDDDDRSRNKSKKNRKKSSDSSSSSGSEYSEESNTSSDEDNSSKKLISTKEDLNKAKLSRYKIEKWCHAPFFKKVALGCYVRIGIGINKGESIYRVAKIIDVVETGKVYQLGTTKTNKGFKLKHGPDERTYRLEFVSNQPFTDEEFSRWKETMEKNDLSLPTINEIETKSKEIQSFVDYRFKDEDFDYIVQEKKKFAKDSNKIVEKKMELLNQREKAIESNDLELVKEIDEKINELNEKAYDINTKRSGNFNLLAQINQRNREKSNAAVEEAMKKEFERLKDAKDDPFQRRKVLPTLVTAINKKNNTSSQESKLASSQESAKSQSIKEEPQSKNTTSGIFEDILSSIEAKPVDTNKSNAASQSNDLFQAHNFDISIDLSVPFNTNQLQPALSQTNMANSGSAISRRALNLDDYKRKKGLI